MEIVVERLQGHNIKPSVQRIAIMKYLMEHRTHPTVDEIYTALSPTIPTLSKTTVYNTLKILSEQGAAQTLTPLIQNATSVNLSAIATYLLLLLYFILLL